MKYSTLCLYGLCVLLSAVRAQDQPRSTNRQPVIQASTRPRTVITTRQPIAQAPTRPPIVVTNRQHVSTRPQPIATNRQTQAPTPDTVNTNPPIQRLSTLQRQPTSPRGESQRSTVIPSVSGPLPGTGPRSTVIPSVPGPLPGTGPRTVTGTGPRTTVLATGTGPRTTVPATQIQQRTSARPQGGTLPRVSTQRLRNPTTRYQANYTGISTTPKNPTAIRTTIPAASKGTIKTTMPPTQKTRATTQKSATQRPTTQRPTTQRPTTQRPTTPPYEERPIRITFISNSNYDTTVAINKTEWESSIKRSIADKSNVAMTRITHLELKNGSVIITFIIETRGRVYQPGDVTTDKAKDILESLVQRNRLRFTGPYRRTLYAERNSFQWEYVDNATPPPSAEEQKSNDSGLMLEEIYIIVIAVGGFIVIVLIVAVVVILCSTAKSKRIEDEGHYDSTNDEEIFITPDSTAKTSSENNGAAELEDTFDY